MRVTPHSNSSPVIVQKWALSSRIFHWVSVLLLVVTWVMIVLNEDAETFTYIQLHKAFGLSLLFWMVGRVINRLFTKAPPDVPMPKSQTIVAHLTHLILYGLLFAMPIAGMLLSMYGNHAINMFGLFTIPVLVTPDEGQAEFFENVHTNIIWTLLLVFSGLHIAGALYHQFIKKDKLIDRMR